MKGVGTLIAGMLLVLALQAVHAQLPTTYDMQQVAPKKDVAKKDALKKDAPTKAAPKKAPPREARKVEPTRAAEKPKQAPKTYSTGPTELRDKDGNVIPTNPEAYPVGSALPKKPR